MSNHQVGMYGGKFIPIHLGHVYAMKYASRIVNELHVIVSYDEDYERKHYYKDAKIDCIPYEIRVDWWKQITKDMPFVYVHAIYEEQTGQFSDWEKGAESIKAVVGKPIDTVFSSEYSYSAYFEKLYPSAKHIVIDPQRTNYNISATSIRKEGEMKHWEILPEVVKSYFVK